MRRPRLALAGIALVLLLVGAVGATAHVNTQDGGPNGDILDGHDHKDKQFGRGGCDQLLGRGEGDEGRGGDSGCDAVRGMEGGGDVAIVCDDNAGSDGAYGGGGPYDICLSSGADFTDLSSCEIVKFLDYNCV